MRCLLEQPQAVSAPGPQTNPRILEVLQYPTLAAPELMLWEGIREVGTSGSLGAVSADHNLEIRDLRAKGCVPGNAEQEPTRNFEAGRQQGIREGRELQCQEQIAADLAAKTELAKHAADLLQQFARQRERYFEQAEREIARFAFAIAERILYREVRIDPVSLTATVRAALSQLATNTNVRLRVPVEDADLWKEELEHAPELTVRPSIIGDEQLHCGDCVVETELGSTDLGIQAQLNEIARSLFNDSSVKTSLKPQSEGSRNSEEPT